MVNNTLRTTARVFLGLLCVGAIIYGLLAHFLVYRDDLMTLISNEEGQLSQLDKKSKQLLGDLGLQGHPRLYPQSYQDTEDLPVFIMTLRSNQMKYFKTFIKSKIEYFRIKKLVIYDAGLTEEEQEQVRNECYCLVRSVPWQRYPAHISKQRHTKIYRPLLLQESLQEFGIVFWCHVTVVFTSEDIYWSLVAAHEHSLVAWSRTDMPTSAFTHYSVFHAFNTHRDKYQFQHMVDPEMALYVNTVKLYNQLMKPWVYCVLNPKCGSPYGAQSTGCTIRRPAYMYTGCHMYDTSIFNVVLGIMFNGEMPYHGKEAIFNITNADHSESSLFSGFSLWPGR